MTLSYLELIRDVSILLGSVVLLLWLERWGRPVGRHRP